MAGAERLRPAPRMQPRGAPRIPGDGRAEDYLTTSAITPVSFKRFSGDFEGFSNELGGSFARYGFAVIADQPTCRRSGSKAPSRRPRRSSPCPRR